MATRAFAIYLGRFYLDRNRSLRDFSAFKLNQPAFQLAFLRHNPLGQDRGELLVKGPQKIKRHRLKFRLFHGRSTTFPIRVQCTILRAIPRSIYLPGSFCTAFEHAPERWDQRLASVGLAGVILDRVRRLELIAVNAGRLARGRSIPVRPQRHRNLLMKPRSIFPTIVHTALIFQLFWLHNSPVST